MNISDILHLDSQVYKLCNDYDNIFTKLADILLNKTLLVINDSLYRLRELELYLFTDDHLDHYTHKSNEQAKSCQWYFHKTGSTYKSGTYKGLDITFGFKDKGKPTFGGILIRGISNDIDLITGPCRVVDHILKSTSSASITDLVDKLGESIRSVNNKSILYLQYNDQLEQLGITYAGPRVGLSFKFPNYAVKNYRYINYPLKQVEKYKPSIIINLTNSGTTVDDVINQSGSKRHQIEKYINFYESGKQISRTVSLKPSATNILVVMGFVDK